MPRPGHLLSPPRQGKRGVGSVSASCGPVSCALMRANHLDAFTPGRPSLSGQSHDVLQRLSGGGRLSRWLKRELIRPSTEHNPKPPCLARSALPSPSPLTVLPRSSPIFTIDGTLKVRVAPSRGIADIAVPSIGVVEPGETVRIECLDWTGGQIHNDDSADDVRDVDLTKIHYLTGPFDIKGSEPGDLLVVNITDVQPFDHSPWGFTGVFAKNNGGGFLDEHYPNAAKAIWDFDGIYCTSRHIPGVRFAGLIHPGILGCAPSAEVLAEWNRREGDLVSSMAHSHPNKVVAQPPNAQNAHAGQASGDVYERIAREGARTIPGRPEHGGNCDINNISRGSTTYLPVHVAGAKFSVGDLHFSQGDGEISFCGAIEMVSFPTI